MLQTAVDLSKQWPQALQRVGLGSIYISLVASFFAGSNLEWLDYIYGKFADGISGSDLYVGLMLVGTCYVLGALFTAGGETELLSWSIDFRVKLAADVFETGNGLLIQRYQETVRNAQLFGGLVSVFFVGGLTIFSISLFVGEEGRVLSEVYGIGRSSSGDVTEIHPSPWKIGLGVIILVFLVFALVRTVRRITRDSFVAIAVQAQLILNKESKVQIAAYDP